MPRTEERKPMSQASMKLARRHLEAPKIVTVSKSQSLALRGTNRTDERLDLAKKAWRIRALLDEMRPAKKDQPAEHVWTPSSLAKHLGLALDTVLTHLYYTEILNTVREAVDVGSISLKLCVVGKDCMCYGFDSEGRRRLLKPAQQLDIFIKLMDAFEGAEIRDNPVTRAVLTKIKSQVLVGTAFEAATKSSRRETKHMQASLAAARKLGLIVMDGFVVDESEDSAEREAEKAARAEKTRALRPRHAVATTLSATRAKRRRHDELMSESEVEELKILLTTHDGNWAAVAREMGVPRPTLVWRAAKLGLKA